MTGFMDLDWAAQILVSHFDLELQSFFSGLYWIDFVKVQNGKKKNNNFIAFFSLVSPCKSVQPVLPLTHRQTFELTAHQRSEAGLCDEV